MLKTKEHHKEGLFVFFNIHEQIKSCQVCGREEILTEREWGYYKLGRQGKCLKIYPFVMSIKHWLKLFRDSLLNKTVSLNIG